MHVYFSGIGGVGIGPLAQIAHEAGHDVEGSDSNKSLMTEQLQKLGIRVHIGQTGKEIEKAHSETPIDWLVISSAIQTHHPEMVFAKKHHIRVSKRDELLNEIITQSQQKLLAISGTHGKTTATAMLVWILKQLDVPVSYSVGTTLSFGPSGHFDPKATYFVYEADEYDRNMLHFHPEAAIIVSLDHDHIDTYPTADDYTAAFRQFVSQAQRTFMWRRDQAYADIPPSEKIFSVDTVHPPTAITLAGEHNRQNALLMAYAASQVLHLELRDTIAAVNTFPGTQRRFEELADNLYTDYAHHPGEIAATLQMASELSDNVVAVYQPHQNIRQHETREMYQNCFSHAQHVYWLPTYLSREDPKLAILTPQELIAELDNPAIAEPADLNENLVQHIRQAHKNGALVLVMGAGTVDEWLRENVAAIVE